MTVPITIWHADHRSGTSGGDATAEAICLLETEGSFITEVGSRPWHHRVIGCGLSHDDAQFSETGRSHAAWTENGEGGNATYTTARGDKEILYPRWWENKRKSAANYFKDSSR